MKSCTAEEPTRVMPPEFFAFKDYQNLFRDRLTGPRLRLFTQLTGLRLHVLWHGPLDFQVSGATPVLCPTAHQPADAKVRPPKCCASCWLRRCELALSPSKQGRQFIGPCGITNFYSSLQVDNVRPLTLVLQARVEPHSPSAHGGRTGENPPVSGKHAGKPVSPAVFRNAVALARLILHDLEATAHAWMARSGLDNALCRLNNAEAEAARLRGKLRHRLPGLPESTVQSCSGRHARKLVETMLAYVHQHYHHPVSLGEIASAMKMNASYLSALFSQTTGVTFHHYLEELRLVKAKDLLQDPVKRVSEVAYAVGYTTPNHFRDTFKTRVGIPPSAWRESASPAGGG